MEWTETWPQIDSIFGWLTEAEARRLYELAQLLGAQEWAIELGAFMGRSTAAIAAGLRARYLRVPPFHASVVSIDTWVGTKDGAPEEDLHAGILKEHGVRDMFELHRKNLIDRGLGKFTRRIRGTTSGTGLEWAVEWNVFPSLLFIDADHRYEAVKADFESWAPRLRTGGHVAFHDAWAPGPSRVIAEMPANFTRAEGAGELAVFQKTQ